MKEKETFLDFCGQVMMNLGISIILLNIFCICFGRSAQGISTMFVFGEKGLSVATMLQFFLLSVLSVALRYLFFKDFLIKKMTTFARTAGLMVSLFVMITIFALLFGWLPIDNGLGWLMFCICFILCMGISISIATYHEKTVNRRMEEALSKLKSNEEKENRKKEQSNGAYD